MADPAMVTPSAFPTDTEIRSKMETLMKTVDLNTMPLKEFIAALSDKLGGVDLKPKKKFIKVTITEILDAMGADDEEDNGDDSSSSEEEAATKKKKGGGLSAVKEISPKLSAFLGCGKEAARTDIVKGLWDYIREHNLQDPNDKRQIILDDKMKEVFGKDVASFSMFTMNKYVSPHIHPFPPLDLTPSTRKRKAEDGGSGRKKKDPKKKTPGLQAPYRLSDDLVAVVGKSILPRPQVTQALWKYIRENELQNPEDKREIICDAKLKRVLGGNSKVTMFSMNKYITAHLLEKMDKSAYKHEDIDSGKKEEDVSSVGEAESSDDDSD